MGITTTSDPSRYLKWFFRINRDNLKTFRILNSNGTAKDLTGYVFQINFRRDKDDEENLLELTSGSGLTIASNDIAARVDKDEAAEFNDDKYFVELVVTQGGRERNWLSGDAIFHNGRFDGIGCDDETLTIEDVGDVIEITVTDSGGGSGSSVNHWVDTDYDPTDGVPTIGTGDGGVISGEDKWKFNGSGTINFAGSITVEVSAGTVMEALTDNPGDDRDNWYFNFGGE